MGEQVVRSMPLRELSVWRRSVGRRVPLTFSLEVTARCNNDCRHCYINLPAGDQEAQAQEMTLAEIDRIADQAVSLGALWCLITGGEPLLRSDFTELYLLLKRKGLLVSVFTNACLITPEHVSLFRKYPPRDLEVTVYGVTPATYERISRRPGSYEAFRRGLDLLRDGGVGVRLKAMAIRSNVHELPEIAEFCRERTRDSFRFDPLLHLRYDRDESRNVDIRSERLSATEIVAIDQVDPERAAALRESCRAQQPIPARSDAADLSHPLLRCGAGNGDFTVSHSGLFRLCSSLWHPGFLYDLRKGSLIDAWTDFVPRVKETRTVNREILDRCYECSLTHLCLWCPAHAFLETGRLDVICEGFCEVAHARVDAIIAANA